MIDKNGNNGLNGGLVTSYLVAHLATFPVEGVKTEHVVEEAEKKLRHYENKDRLWPQNLVMRVDEFHLQLETPDEEVHGGEVVERLPISSIQLCSVAADLKKQKEILLVLTKPSEGAELYCFTCLATWAKEIRDDINSAIRDAKKNSSSRPGTLSRQKQKREMEGVDIDIIPPPPANPPPAVPVTDSVKRRLDKLRTTQVMSRLMNPAEQSFGADALDYESVFVYRVDRNVQILNHCLDDIEVFISRLQKASQAQVELSERRKRTKSGRSSSASSIGEGLYTIRSKPPKKEEYIATLAKLKFAFILLGELHGHINNPSASDLIHFLFKPLNIIVQSCRGPELAQTVLTPLHTEKALKQLRETMSPPEAELFFSLGERWTKSRESWPNPDDVVDFSPSFNSGWLMPPNNPPPTEHPATLLEQRFPDKEEIRVRVLKDFTARDEMELTVRAEEVLIVLDDSRKWWHCRNEQHQVGYVPSNVLIKTNLPRKNSFISSDDGHSSISFGDELHSSSVSHGLAVLHHSRQKSDLSSPRPISEPTPPPPHNPPPPLAPPPPPAAAPAPPGPPPLSIAAIVAAKATMDKKRQAPQRVPSQRMEMTDTFKKELSRRVNNTGSRDFVLPQKPKKNAKRFNLEEINTKSSKIMAQVAQFLRDYSRIAGRAKRRPDFHIEQG